jgi:hypothetical protein
MTDEERKRREREQQNAPSMPSELFGGGEDFGAQFNIDKPMQDMAKHAGGATQGFVNLTDKVNEAATRLDSLGKMEGQRAKGSLFDAGFNEQVRVVSTMMDKWGEKFQLKGRTVPYGETAASRETGYHIKDIQQVRRMAERGEYGPQFQEGFGYIRRTDLPKRGDQYANDPTIFTNALKGLNQPINQKVDQIGTSLAVETRQALEKGIQGAVKPFVQQPAQPTAPPIGGAGMGGFGGGIPPAHPTVIAPGGGPPAGGGGGGAGFGGGMGGPGGPGGHGGGFDMGRFLEMASPFSPMSMSWMAMFAMSGQL